MATGKGRYLTSGKLDKPSDGILLFYHSFSGKFQFK